MAVSTNVLAASALIAAALIEPALSRETSQTSRRAVQADHQQAQDQWSWQGDWNEWQGAGVRSSRQGRRAARARSAERAAFAPEDGRGAWAYQEWAYQDQWQQQPSYGPRAEPSAARPAVDPDLQSRVAHHAAANGLPDALVHRVIMRESRYNPRVVSKGNYGLMQIRLGTARAMGYTGSAAGLLDPDVNMTYAMRYLAGAYRAAGGNHDRAVSNYARGYYYQAKAQGFSPYAMNDGAASSFASARNENW